MKSVASMLNIGVVTVWRWFSDKIQCTDPHPHDKCVVRISIIDSIEVVENLASKMSRQVMSFAISLIDFSRKSLLKKRNHESKCRTGMVMWSHKQRDV